MGLFNFIKNKKNNINNLSVNEKQNLISIIKISVFNQILEMQMQSEVDYILDDTCSPKLLSAFNSYKLKEESNIIPEHGLSFEETTKKLIPYLKNDNFKFELLRLMTESERNDFIEHLFAFINVDKKIIIKRKTRNYKSEILKNLFINKSEKEITGAFGLESHFSKKYSNSKVFSKRTNKKLIRFSNGSVHMELSYKYGEDYVLNGNYKEFFESSKYSKKGDKLHMELSYKYGEDILNGPFKEFYESGKLKREGKFKDGKWHGRIKDYSEEGVLLSDAMMENGIENGNDFSYHNNGKIKQKTIKIDGKIDGLAEVFDENGNKLMDQIYVLGEETGRSREFFPNGDLKKIAEKENGEYVGILKSFYESGQLQVELDFSTKLMRTYNLDGTIHTEKTLEG
jgi:antitoxin component YwqK of YwqJK toxin-antitoxin module